MEPSTIALITVGLLMMAILLGMHVGIALATLSLIGFWWIKGNFAIALNILGATAYRSIMEYVFGVVPMFIIMGEFANLSGASRDLYDSANALLVRVKGGLGIATVLANAVFAAISGVSIASAAIFSRIALPQMLRLGYDRKFSLGAVAGSSVLGMLIPPSLLLIVYGILTEEAIGKLFIAGVLPGIILTIIYSLGIFLMVLINPRLAGERIAVEKMDLKFFLRTLVKPWALVVLIIIVLGGIYAGWFTPTEAGAIGASGTLLLALIRGKVTPHTLWRTLLAAGYTTASIYFLVICAQMYSRMLTLSGLPAQVSQTIGAMPISPLMITFLFVVVFLILGCIMDSVSILLVVVPLLLPVINVLNLNIIWFGIVSVIAVEMGLLTPPFGLCVFAMKSALGDEVTIEEIFSGSVPYLLMMVFTLLIIIFFPALSTWLPSMM